MTRDQDFERRLADWLEGGPVTAPSEVVDRALEQATRRRQWSGASRWLVRPFGIIGRWFPTQRLVRATALATVLAIVLLTGLVVSVPFDGGPGRVPEMDDTTPRVVAGVTRVVDETNVYGRITRTLEVEVDDPRIDGEALQVLQAELDPGNGMSFARGMMRLENDWGTWEGPIDFARYPTGEEVEMASLTGSGAYDGYIFLYAIHDQPPGTERTLEGAIWPDEPPSMPDPSQLP